MTARWIVLVLYLALMIGIGVYYRRKSASVNDFVLGGRGLGAWFTAFAYGTSYFSAVIFVGYAGKFGWNYGVASTWVGIGNAVIGSWIRLAMEAIRVPRPPMFVPIISAFSLLVKPERSIILL